MGGARGRLLTRPVSCGWTAGLPLLVFGYGPGQRSPSQWRRSMALFRLLRDSRWGGMLDSASVPVRNPACPLCRHEAWPGNGRGCGQAFGRSEKEDRPVSGAASRSTCLGCPSAAPSISRAARRNSWMVFPSARPTSGSLPGPKMMRASSRMTSSSPGPTSNMSNPSPNCNKTSSSAQRLAHRNSTERLDGLARPELGFSGAEGRRRGRGPVP